jgi:hypothetical protein
MERNFAEGLCLKGADWDRGDGEGEDRVVDVRLFEGC